MARVAYITLLRHTTRQELGESQARKRILEAAGWEVVVIDYRTWPQQWSELKEQLLEIDRYACALVVVRTSHFLAADFACFACVLTSHAD